MSDNNEVWNERTLTVLDLLPVTWRLLQCLDDQGGGRGNHLHAGLTVLDDEPNGDLEALPVPGGLHDVITNLLGRQTEGTNLGGQGGGGGHLTSNTPKTYCGHQHTVSYSDTSMTPPSHNTGVPHYNTVCFQNMLYNIPLSECSCPPCCMSQNFLDFVGNSCKAIVSLRSVSFPKRCSTLTVGLLVP